MAEASEATITATLEHLSNEPTEPFAIGPNGEVFVHERYKVHNAGHDDHMGPINTELEFGDVASWAAYVLRYGSNDLARLLLRWSEGGLFATFDHHTDASGAGDHIDTSTRAGRDSWLARYPFVRTHELDTWEQFANGLPVSQSEAVEFLDTYAAHIQSPAAADLVALLRTLRASANHRAVTTIKPEGGTRIEFLSDQHLTAGPDAMAADLPSEFTIGIPLLAGHSKLYALRVRVRAVVGSSNAALALRFTLPNLEASIEHAYGELVELAREALGDPFADTLLRAG
jgi:hypothetical protein